MHGPMPRPPLWFEVFIILITKICFKHHCRGGISSCEYRNNNIILVYIIIFSIFYHFTFGGIKIIARQNKFMEMLFSIGWIFYKLYFMAVYCNFDRGYVSCVKLMC